MYVVRLLVISALLVCANCDCSSTYLECFGDILRDIFFKSDPESDTVYNGSKTEVFDLTHGEGSFETVLSEITDFIKNVDLGLKQTDLVTHSNNITKIVVKTLELDDDFKKLEPVNTPTVAEITTDIPTTEFNILDELNIIETTTDITKVNNISVIPLKSDKDNEINSEYNLEEEPDYLNIDYVELYKDTTNEPVQYVPTEPPAVTEYSELRAEIDRQENEIENLIEHSIQMVDGEALKSIIENVTKQHSNIQKPTLASSVFPWVAAIFLKNNSGSQFDYFCDGAILSETAVLTAARCVHNGNETYSEENFIVILGKTSLQASGDSEKILRVKSVTVHENFTSGNDTTNDLAILILEEPIIFNDEISPANLTSLEELQEDEETADDVTTAWSPRGDLTLIYFDKAKGKACGTHNKVENTFCATYGDAVALCPSYGGLYVSMRADQAYLTGIRTGDPLDRGVCFSKEVAYTSLQNYSKWISDIFDNKVV